MKRLKYILPLLLFFCWLPAMAQSDIEVTDSTSTDWGDNIGGEITPDMPTDPVTSIILSQTSITIEGGESIRLTAQTNSTAANKRVIWSVTDESVATVADNGTVMGRQMGTTIVTATSVSNPEISASCEVTVTSDYVEPNLIVYTDGNGTVIGGGVYAEGTEVTLTAIPNGGYRFVKWSDGSTANPYTFILYGTTELMAFFEPIEGEGLGNGRIVSIPGGDYNVFYTDDSGKRWYLHAAGYNNWAVSETPKTIKFTAGNITDGQAFVNAASFMESNGYYMSNVSGWDGTGSINTVPVNEGLGTEKRTWESQVFYKNDEGKHAIRLTNTIGTDWGGHLFVNIDPATLEIFAGQPSLGDALYLWEIEKSGIVYKVYYYIGEELVHTVEVVSGEKIPEYIYTQMKEGHTFNGWTGLPDTMPAKDVTVTGSFVTNGYTLTYVVDGKEYKTFTVEYGATITAEDEPTKEGHTFSGWSEIPETMPAEDVTVTGSFIVNKYLVTFKIDDEVIASDSLEYGAAIVAPEASEKEGYTFDGWGEVAETVPASDVTYEGTYSVNMYKVYYYVGEELVNTIEVAYGEVIPEYIYEPTGEGDVFEGWIGETYETMPAHDVTYVANITNGIDAMSTDDGQQTTVIYDLMGRKVTDTENLKGGIYIVNGRKVVINDYR